MTAIDGPGRRLRRDRQMSQIDSLSRRIAGRLRALSSIDAEQVFALVDSRQEGLSGAEAADRLAQDGPNTVAHESRPSAVRQFLTQFADPFVLILAGLAAVMVLTTGTGLIGDESGEWLGPATLATMILISVVLRFWQERRSESAAEQLKAMVTSTVAVRRRGGDTPVHVETDPSPIPGPAVGGSNGSGTERIPVDQIVTGDVVELAAGDLIPADLRIVWSNELAISESALTGESMPVDKHHLMPDEPIDAEDSTDGEGGLVDLPTMCLMGTSVTSGSAVGVVVATGVNTFYGVMAQSLVGEPPESSFDRGIRSVSRLLIRVMVAIVPLVFVINGVTKGDWSSAFFFAIAVAVGLTPEMLPLIVTANLARGAIVMSRHQVIVRQIASMQNLGAMDVLCTDKTGTLTEDRVILQEHLDASGGDSPLVLTLAALNSRHQSGMANLLDDAIVEHALRPDSTLVDLGLRPSDHAELVPRPTGGTGSADETGPIEETAPADVSSLDATLVDEIPFDFDRRRMSVVLRSPEGHLIATKGGFEETLSVCTHAVDRGEIVPMTSDIETRARELAEGFNADGIRLLAVAFAQRPAQAGHRYTVSDERDLVLAGILTFLDPPKESAREAIASLTEHGVDVKVITGDSPVVAAKVCEDVGLSVRGVMTGGDVEEHDDDQLVAMARDTTLFAMVSPLQKARIIRALQADDHTVGFLGDGINDAAALREADVGVSVDNAVEVARASADIVLLDKSLTVLEQGVTEGRRTFGNIMKYVKMTVSSNFGNVLSILVASAFLPFEPMPAIMLLVQNFLYDVSQLTIPWDNMDRDYLDRPRRWRADDIGRFMLYIGPVSSIFDITTFLFLWYAYDMATGGDPAVFQTGWFIVGLLSQTLIVHLIRTRRIPFIQSMASPPVLVLTVVVMALGVYLPFSPLAGVFGFVSVPGSYFPFLALTLAAYCVATQIMKVFYIRRFDGEWL